MSYPEPPPERVAGRDLPCPPLPAVGDPDRPLDELYRWTERQGRDAAGWYLRRCGSRRRTAKALRGTAVLAGAAGVVVPIAALAVPGPAGWSVYGYGALALAAGCLGADRWLGVTSGWVRDMSTAMAVRRRTSELQFAWAAEAAGRTDGDPLDAVGLLREFSEDLADLLDAETSAWATEFGHPITPAAARVPSDTSHPGQTGSRARHPSGLPPRPNMPRQRPPEASP